MRALMYEGPRQMVLREVPRPKPAPDEVLVEVAASGICGSELSGFLGESSLRQPPLIFGHEFSGRVVERGSQTTISTGTRVTANPLISCGTCQYCQQSQEQLCGTRKLLGAARPGSNASYIAVPESSLVALPDSLSFDAATLAEPIAYAIHVIESAGVGPKDTLVVMGMGPIGLFVLQVARHYGCAEVYAVDTNPNRLAIADALGASATLNPQEVSIKEVVAAATGGLGATIVVDAVGNTAARHSAVSTVRRGGTVVFSGLHSQESLLPINDMVRNEVATVGAFAYTAAQFRQAVALVGQGAVGLKEEWMVKSDLKDGAQWFARLVDNPGPIAKVLLVP